MKIQDSQKLKVYYQFILKKYRIKKRIICIQEIIDGTVL